MSYKQYCKDYENIENYQKALADNFNGWEVHHRLETHSSDGQRRIVDITAAELKALGMYYNRPASELIFLRKGEHSSLRKVSEETRKKLSEANKGENNPMYGKHFSEESKKKMREAKKGKPGPNKGKKFSEETRNKMSEAKKNISEETRNKLSAAKKGNTYAKGMHFFNNGEINIRAKECPPGFVPGRLRK